MNPQEAPNNTAAPAASDAESVAAAKLQQAERKILYSQPTSDKVVEMLRSQMDKPEMALALTATMVIRVMGEATSGKIPPGAVKGFRDVLLADIADLANAVGLQVGPETIAGAKKLLDQAAAAAAQQRSGRAPAAGAQPPNAPPMQPQRQGGGLIASAM